MLVSDFDFKLPDQLIAQHPITPREKGRLLHVSSIGDPLIKERSIGDLTDIIRPKDLLIVNNTKVIPSRLFGQREGGSAMIEVLLLKQLSQKPLRWTAYIKPLRRLSIGEWLTFSGDFKARLVEKYADGQVCVELSCADHQLYQWLEKVGRIPLPPYITRQRQSNDEFLQEEIQDRTDYQTIFAEEQGAVAAPTAGLHITSAMRDKLRQKNVNIAQVTLHVGAGTFQPVKVKEVDQHQMHHEWGEVSAQVFQQMKETKAQGGRVIALGTTSLRILETVSSQSKYVTEGFSGETNIFITPGYDFKWVDALITNFHLPKSTLFMLVCAFSGVDIMKKAYGYAIENQFRFFSYGDACFLERDEAGGE